MFVAALEYLLVFAVSISFIAMYQRIYNNTYFRFPYSKERIQLSRSVFCFFGCLSVLPVIAMFGLRYGIGPDYYTYRYIFNEIHSVGIFEYFANHLANKHAFYVEPGYYILNYICPSFHLVLWSCGIIIYCLLFLVIKDYSKRMSFAFALFIYLSTQYLYSFTIMRSSMAVCFVLAAYYFLIQGKDFKYILFVFLGALFHKTTLCCLPLWFLKQYKNKNVNNIRNIMMIVTILLFPIIASSLLQILRMIPIFARYFSSSVYAASASINWRWTWIPHVFFVIVPLFIVAKKEIFAEMNTSVLFRIYMMEIPFRMLGLYNAWYVRFARFAQIALVLFLPLVIARIKNKQKRMLLYIYYTAWFIFYYAYYVIVNDQGDTVPYVSIFSA